MTEEQRLKADRRSTLNKGINHEILWIGYHKSMVRKCLRGTLRIECLNGYATKKDYNRSHCKKILERRFKIKQYRLELLILS